MEETDKTKAANETRIGIRLIITFLSIMGLWFSTYNLAMSSVFIPLLGCIIFSFGLTGCICWNDIKDLE